MSEATVDSAAEVAASLDAERAEREKEAKADAARLKKMARLHFVAVMAAITLWGAADAWAALSGWALAQGVAIANAFIAAIVTAAIVHEWGHLAGARLSGSRSPVNEKPINYFFIFDFDFDANDDRQFEWMSWGGILAPWLLVIATLLLIPIDTIGRATLLAVLAAQAAGAGLFEVPVVQRVSRGGDPRAELGRRLKSGGLKTSERMGWAVGAVVWLGVWLLI